MEIKYRLRNFWAFGDKMVEVDLTTKGLTLVRGKHLTSTAKSTNAVGKTSLLHGLIWLLYDKYPPKAVKSSVTNSATGKNCYGEVEIDFRGKHAEIYRGINHDEITIKGITVAGDFLLFFLDGKDVREATNTASQKAVEVFLGLDYDSFVTAVLFTTTDEAFSSQSSSKQDKILTTLLHLEELEGFRQKVLIKQKEVKDEIVDLDRKRQTKEVLRNEYTEQVKDWRTSIAEWEAEKKVKRESLKSKVVSLEDETEDCEDELEILELGVNEVKKELGEQHPDFDSVLKAVADCQSDYREQMEELTTEFGGVSSKIRDLRGEIKTLQDLNGKAECPTCKHELTEEHIYAHVKTLNIQLETKTEKQEVLEKLRGEIRSLIEQAKAEESTLRSQQNDLVRLRSELKRKEDKIEAVHSLIEEKQRAMQSYLRSIEALDREESPQQRDTIETEKKIEKLCKELTELFANRAELLTLQDDLDFCEKMFGPSGIRNYLVRSTIPKLNEDANRFSDVLTNGELTILFTGEKEVGSGKNRATRNKLQVRVEDQYGSDTYDACSGGEKRRVDICVNLALNYLVASRVGLPFVFMDEIFLSLDNRGKEKVMELLQVISEEIPSIFVISNQDDIMSDEFDNIWTVIREGKSSWMEEE